MTSSDSSDSSSVITGKIHHRTVTFAANVEQREIPPEDYEDQSYIKEMPPAKLAGDNETGINLESNDCTISEKSVEKQQMLEPSISELKDVHMADVKPEEESYEVFDSAKFNISTSVSNQNLNQNETFNTFSLLINDTTPKTLDKRQKLCNTVTDLKYDSFTVLSSPEAVEVQNVPQAFSNAVTSQNQIFDSFTVVPNQSEQNQERVSTEISENIENNSKEVFDAQEHKDFSTNPNNSTLSSTQNIDVSFTTDIAQESKVINTQSTEKCKEFNSYILLSELKKDNQNNSHSKKNAEHSFNAYHLLKQEFSDDVKKEQSTSDNDKNSQSSALSDPDPFNAYNLLKSNEKQKTVLPTEHQQHQNSTDEPESFNAYNLLKLSKISKNEQSSIVSTEAFDAFTLIKHTSKTDGEIEINSDKGNKELENKEFSKTNQQSHSNSKTELLTETEPAIERVNLQNQTFETSSTEVNFDENSINIKRVPIPSTVQDLKPDYFVSQSPEPVMSSSYKSEKNNNKACISLPENRGLVASCSAPASNILTYVDEVPLQKLDSEMVTVIDLPKQVVAVQEIALKAVSAPIDVATMEIENLPEEELDRMVELAVEEDDEEEIKDA